MLLESFYATNTNCGFINFIIFIINFYLILIPGFFARNALPGTKECDTSLDQIGHMIHDLDQASLAVVSGDPTVATNLGDGRSLEMCHDQVLNSAWQLHDLVEPIQLAAKGETGNLGHLVRIYMVMYMIRIFKLFTLFIVIIIIIHKF